MWKNTGMHRILGLLSLCMKSSSITPPSHSNSFSLTAAMQVTVWTSTFSPCYLRTGPRLLMVCLHPVTQLICKKKSFRPWRYYQYHLSAIVNEDKNLFHGRMVLGCIQWYNSSKSKLQLLANLSFDWILFFVIHNSPWREPSLQMFLIYLNCVLKWFYDSPDWPLVWM